jgi:hypothetical protein
MLAHQRGGRLINEQVDVHSLGDPLLCLTSKFRGQSPLRQEPDCIKKN